MREKWDERTSVERVEDGLVVLIGEEVLAHVVVGSVAAIAAAGERGTMHGERTFDRTGVDALTASSS